MKDLLPNEIIVHQVGNFTLTNKRVRIQKGKDFHSAFLYRISSIQTSFTEHLVLLFVAIFPLLASIYLVIGRNDNTVVTRSDDQLLFGSIVLTIILIASYFLSRQRTIKIMLDSGANLEFASKWFKGSLEPTIFKIETELEKLRQ